MTLEGWMERIERIERVVRKETTHGVNLISMVVATHGANAITMEAFSDLQLSRNSCVVS